MADVSIAGLPELQANLASLPERVQRKVLGPALREGGQVILKRTRQNAPRLSGDLAKSYKLRAAKRSRKNKSVTLQITTGKTLFSGKTFYGGFIEYGTAKMRGRHFMAQAFTQVAGTANTVAVTRIKEGIEREGSLGAVARLAGATNRTNFSAIGKAD